MSKVSINVLFQALMLPTVVYEQEHVYSPDNWC